ncbi:MAG: O-antigen ligase family protein [Cyanobacteria bacterium J06650_10]
MQPSSELSRSSTHSSSSLLPKAISFGIVGFYVLFTLLPNSNSLMVKWPCVFIWQFGLMLGPVMLLFQLWQGSFRKLGARLDWLAIAWTVALVFSASLAEFTHQAFWYTWAALCSLAFLYVLNAWLTSANRVYNLLVFQGLLSTAFSAYSLSAWLLQTVKPQLAVLAQLKAYGIERSFDLTEVTLRNWHPLGHQNYVAGYLVLALPLLVGLAFSAKGRVRVAWLCSFVLGLATLYSTASRGSLLGIAASIFVFVVLSIRNYPELRKRLLGVGAAGFVGIVLWGLSSDRIRSSIVSMFTVDPTLNPSYRAITNATGWFMGLDHPILGAGLGSVTLLYQKYRPTWASGSESELTYQLHSTPAQMWAELGLIGIGLTLLTVFAVAVLSLRCCNPQRVSKESTIPLPLLIGLISGLAGYSVYAITDYQLDNLCISGTIITFIAVLISENRTATKLNEFIAVEPAPSLSSKRITLVGTGLIIAVSIWLYPIHRAWMLSSQGFLALQQQDVPSFVAYLEKAHDLAPWEPYYPYQLGWNLGELAFQSSDVDQQSVLAQESVKWFEKVIALSPHREFGYSNLGWLLVNSEPQKAVEAFSKAIQLVPNKNGSYFSLGYSLLKAGQPELAIQSMKIAVVHSPILLTSPIWQSSELATLYPRVLDSFQDYLQQQVTLNKDNHWQRKAYQVMGMLLWWQGEFAQSAEAFSHSPNSLNDTLLMLADSRHADEMAVAAARQLESNALVSTWAHSDKSRDLLLQSILSRASTLLLDESTVAFIASEIEESAAAASNFHDWLTRTAPSRQRRNQRLGFGTISRHIDGSLPRDFFVISENILTVDYLLPLFPRPASVSELKSLVEKFKESLSV